MTPETGSQPTGSATWLAIPGRREAEKAKEKVDRDPADPELRPTRPRSRAPAYYMVALYRDFTLNPIFSFFHQIFLPLSTPLLPLFRPPFGLLAMVRFDPPIRDNFPLFWVTIYRFLWFRRLLFQRVSRKNFLFGDEFGRKEKIFLLEGPRRGARATYLAPA